jgi:hypothetical protein
MSQLPTSRPQWDAYNARSLLDEEVADRFVPPPFFERLVGPRHQLVVGPRGSGKTTLLRMLQTNSLQYWQHPDAQRIRDAVTFEGIFVPADRSWGEQFRGERESDEETDVFGILSQATCSTHVFRSFVRTLLQMRSESGDSAASAGRRASLSRNDEVEISARLASSWGLEHSLPSFRGLRQELRTRIAMLGRLRKRLRTGRTDSSALSELEWLDLDLLDEISNGTELVNDCLMDDGRRWALLFDELEVAPRSIRQSLLGSLRVPDPRLILKLALSPYPGSLGMLPRQSEDYAHAPREGNDFDVISLSYAQRVDVDRFGKQILDRLVRDSEGVHAAPEQLFGQSKVSTPAAQWMMSGTAYGPESPRLRELAEYVRTDLSVLGYLQSHGVNVDDVGVLKPTRRAAHLRKIAPLVALREFYTVPERGAVRRRFRQRNTFEFYTGLSSLLALSEGNPRSVLNLFTPMLEVAAHGRLARVPQPVQSRAIRDAIATFRTLLITIPAPTAGTFFTVESRQRSARRGLLDVLDRIGSYFADATYAVDFSPDPAGSFIVDSHLPDAALESIESAVNIGAIIFVPDDDGMNYFGSVKGKRFRLNYLLAAHHRLPLRLGRSVSLSSIFEGAPTDAAPPAEEPQLHLDLSEEER